MKEPILKESFIYILISGKASKLILHFLAPKAAKELQKSSLHRLCLQPWADAVCGAPSNLFLPAPGLTDPHRFLFYSDQKVAPGYFFILLDSFIGEILLWQFLPVLRSFEVPHRTHTFLYFYAVSSKLSSFTLAYNKVYNRVRILQFSLVIVWTCHHSHLLPFSHSSFYSPFSNLFSSIQ